MNDLTLKRINGKALLYNLKCNKSFLGLYAVVLFSLLTGVLVFKFENNSAGSFGNLFLSAYLSAENASLLSAFFGSFASSFLFLLILFVLGSGVCGYFVVPAILFVKTVGYGYIGGYLYSAHGIKGVCFYLLTVVPSALILLMCYVFAAKESVKFSQLFLNSVKKESKPTKFSNDFKLYSIRSLIIFSVTLLGNLVEALTKFAFLGLFDF